MTNMICPFALTAVPSPYPSPVDGTGRTRERRMRTPSVAYSMTMMCLEATTTILATEVPMPLAIRRLYEKLTDDGVVWLGVADSFGKDLGRTATDDLDMSIGRLVAEGNLLGDEVSDARQQQVYDACQKFLTPPPAAQ